MNRIKGKETFSPSLHSILSEGRLGGNNEIKEKADFIGIL
jgi:hypothetical protein